MFTIRIVVLSIVAGLAALVVPALALAEPPSPTNDATEARRHFDAGFNLFQARVFEAALVEFEQSYALGHRPSALRNVAQCQRELKRFAAAHSNYATLVARHQAEFAAEERAEYERAMADLELVTGLVAITAPDGATIGVDGVERGTAPLTTTIRLDVGSHHARVEKVGFSPGERDFVVLAQRSIKVAIDLAPVARVGTVRVRERTNQPVRVLVDGKDVGPAPWEGELPAGRHQVGGQGPRLDAPRQTIEVIAGAVVELVLDAIPAETRIRVMVLPVSATIIVDGYAVGTGTYDGELSTGEHELRVAQAGYHPVYRKVRAIPGRTVAEEINLAPMTEGRGEPDRPKPDGNGIYGVVFAFGQFQAGGTSNVWGCGLQQRCEASAPLGGGLGFRLGYSFKSLGVEMAALFGATYQRQQMDASGVVSPPGSVIGPTDPSGRREILSIKGFSPFVGVGARFTTPGTVRVTAGITPGVATRSMPVSRTIQGGVSANPPALLATRVGFGLAFDVGLEVGSSPGTKLVFALQALVDASGDVVVGSGSNYAASTSRGPVIVDGPLTVSKSPSIYLGPSLGLRFGH